MRGRGAAFPNMRKRSRVEDHHPGTPSTQGAQCSRCQHHPRPALAPTRHKRGGEQGGQGRLLAVHEGRRCEAGAHTKRPTQARPAAGTGSRETIPVRRGQAGNEAGATGERGGTAGLAPAQQHAGEARQ